MLAVQNEGPVNLFTDSPKRTARCQIMQTEEVVEDRFQIGPSGLCIGICIGGEKAVVYGRALKLKQRQAGWFRHRSSFLALAALVAMSTIVPLDELAQFCQRVFGIMLESLTVGISTQMVPI